MFLRITVKSLLAIVMLCMTTIAISDTTMTATTTLSTCETIPASEVCTSSVVSALTEAQNHPSLRHDKGRHKNRERRRQPPSGVKLHSDLEYALVEGQSLKLDLYMPENAGAAPPLIIWIHGGGWANGDKRKINPAVIGLSGDGYAVASLNYRLQGLSSHPAQIHDVKGAVRWLRANVKSYGYDANRVAVGGGSAGGHLALLLGLSADDKYLEGEVGGNLSQSSSVQAVINMFGPSALQNYADVSRRFRKNKGSDPVLLKSASPLTYLNSEAPPLLIVHGGQDKVVPVSQSINLHRDYQQAGLDSTLHVIEGAGHGGKLFTDLSLQRMMKKFLDSHVKQRNVEQSKVLNLAGKPVVSHGLSNQKKTSDIDSRQNTPALHGFHWIIGPRSGLAGSEKKFNRLLREIEQTLSTNSLISGVYIITHWNLIEAQEGRYDFERLDRVIDLVRSYGRYYKLAFAPGIYTPQWLYDKGALSFDTVGSNIQRVNIYKKPVKIPLPWDPVYLASYYAMLEQVAKRYSYDKSFRAITATVATFMSPEWHLPHSASDREKWRQLNAFDGKLEKVWKQGIDRFAKLFYAQFIVVEASSYPVGQKDLGDSVIDYGVKNYAGRFAVQINQLMGRVDQIDRPTYIKLRDYRDIYGSRIVIGLQNLKGWSFPGIRKKQGSKEMTAFNYLQADGEYWELWYGDGKNKETVATLQALIDQGRAQGLLKFKEELLANDKYRPPGRHR